MADPNPLTIAYELLDGTADVHGRDGLVAMHHPLEEGDGTVTVYERTGTDCEPERASLHLSKIDRWSVSEVERIHWSSEGIDATLTAESGPAAEFCK